MISIETRDFGQDEWNDIVSHMGQLSLMQTWEFGEAKAKTGPWEVSRAMFWSENEIIGVAQGMIRKIPFIKKGLVWINRAPLVINEELVQMGIYDEILKELKKYWVDKRNMYLRIAPPLNNTNYSRDLFNETDFSFANEMDGWASAIVDLSLSNEEIRKNLKQKWRNCLNKAERLGVKYQKGSSEKLINELLSDYKVLLDKNIFSTNVTPELLKTIQKMLSNERRMLVFAGRHNGKQLGSILIATYGKTSTYLVGTTNNYGRKLNANYFLLWAAICEMKKRGFKWFDVGGAHSVNTPSGILHFKKGLQGEPYQLIGEIEAFQNNIINNLIKKRVAFSR